jgi:hypothetical protein
MNIRIQECVNASKCKCKNAGCKDDGIAKRCLLSLGLSEFFQIGMPAAADQDFGNQV